MIIDYQPHKNRILYASHEYHIGFGVILSAATDEDLHFIARHASLLPIIDACNVELKRRETL